MRCPSHKLHSQLAAASKTWVGVAFIMQSTKLVSAKINFMAICEIYGPRKLYGHTNKWGCVFFLEMNVILWCHKEPEISAIFAV